MNRDGFEKISEAVAGITKLSVQPEPFGDEDIRYLGIHQGTLLITEDPYFILNALHGAGLMATSKNDHRSPRLLYLGASDKDRVLNFEDLSVK